jgi:hypothetical protein
VDEKTIEGVVAGRLIESIVTAQLVPLAKPSSTNVTVYSAGRIASNVTFTV